MIWHLEWGVGSWGKKSCQKVHTSVNADMNRMNFGGEQKLWQKTTNYCVFLNLSFLSQLYFTFFAIMHVMTLQYSTVQILWFGSCWWIWFYISRELMWEAVMYCHPMHYSADVLVRLLRQTLFMLRYNFCTFCQAAPAHLPKNLKCKNTRILNSIIT